ncbi:MAG: DUF2339 domain-containing protein [Caldimonas sp.]
MTSIMAVIVGGVLGALAGAGQGALFGALIGWLAWQSTGLQRRIKALEHDLDALRKSALGTLGPTARPTPAQGVPVALGAQAASGAQVAGLPEEGLRPAVFARSADAPVVATGAAPAGLHPLSARAADAMPGGADPAEHGFSETMPGGIPPTLGDPVERMSGRRMASSIPNRVDAIRGWLFGGNTIVKLGVGILFIGLAFLAKFATENVHVPVELRLVAIGAVALVLLGLGWRLRDRRPGYAQVLQGGAVAMLYLTLFVAFRFYGVLSAPAVFTLMALVAALAAALAVLQDARALAVIGALGGFAAPLLVSTGDGNHLALFSYYLVLDLGIAAVAWHKTWRSLNLVGFFATFVVATAWGVLKYSEARFASSEAFLIAFFLLFVAIMVMPARRVDVLEEVEPHVSDAWVNSSLLFGLPTVVFALQYGLVRHTDYGVALSALAMAGFYVVLARWMRSKPQLGLTFDASLAIGTVFLTLVIPFALDARSTSGAWALEGAGLVWIGLRQRRGLARAFGYALLALAGFSMLYAHERHGVPASIFNAYLFNALMAAAASLAAAFFVQRHVKSLETRIDEAVAEPLLIGWATLWLLAAAALEIQVFVAPSARIAVGLACISVVAAIYVALAVRLDWRGIALAVAGHAPAMALATLATAATLASPSHSGGAWAWPIALTVHLAVLRFAAPRWPTVVGHAMHALGALVVAALGALQGRWITLGWGDAASAWPWLGWLVVPAALLLLLPRPTTARRWPVSALPEAYQATASAVLAAGLLLWTVIANVASDGSARPLPPLPLINPLDVGIGLALVAVWSWARTEPARRLLAAMPSLASSLLAIAGFVWLNAMLVRGFHHYAGVPYRIDAWTASLAVQTGITLLWTATALVLMWFSAHRSARVAWMVGAGLLAAVVVKLLLVDLSGSGTVTRIVSFIGVGALMLVIGYVAPLPTKEEKHAAV